MKVLYLTNKPIYPMVDGGCVAMASFLNHLLNIHTNVDHLTVSTHKHPFYLKNYTENINEKINIQSISINTKLSVLKAFLNLFSSSSYNIIRFYNKDFEKKLVELLKQNYSVIYLESIYLLPYLNTIRINSKAKVILRAPNIEHKIWEKLIDNTFNPLKKIYLYSLAKKLKKYELNMFNKVDGILSISEIDTSFIKEHNSSLPVLNLPFAIKTNKINTIQKNHFFFIGAYNWKPNLEAVTYLIQELFPKIVEINPDAKLHIAGSYTPDFLYKFQKDSISIHGKVDSVKNFMQNHGILIAPIFSGSGVRIKILEALSYGIPVIGSSMACQGIKSNACLIANNEEEYLNHIDFINHSDLLEIQNHAIDYINEHYHPTEIERKLNAFITSC